MRYSLGDDQELRRSGDGADLERAAKPAPAVGHPGGCLRKLRLLNQAKVLGDLRVPPGNRLEALKGDRMGQHSVRINDRWRICFVWREGGPSDVGVVDYHG